MVSLLKQCQLGNYNKQFWRQAAIEPFHISGLPSLVTDIQLELRLVSLALASPFHLSQLDEVARLLIVNFTAS